MKWLNLDYKKLSSHKPAHLAIDSTGVKIYGDGEWHVKIHGESKRKKWRKMTLGICPKTHEILLELGIGFCFLARQKRIIIDDKDFHLDLLFFHRRLKRLVAIELKLGDFKPEHKG